MISHDIVRRENIEVAATLQVVLESAAKQLEDGGSRY
jgi:hypothetical protein